MAIPEISIAQFNKIANGDYNAGFAMYGNDHNIVNKERLIEVDYGDTDGIVDAIKQNAEEVRGDKDYTIDIGV